MVRYISKSGAQVQYCGVSDSAYIHDGDFLFNVLRRSDGRLDVELRFLDGALYQYKAMPVGAVRLFLADPLGELAIVDAFYGGQ